MSESVTETLLKRLTQFTTFIPETQCLEFLGAGPKGYKRICFAGKQVLVHRLSAHLFFGFDINSKYFVCHKCDNRKCWNPMHLFIGDVEANNKDMFAKGRNRNQNTNKTHCPSGHEYNKENTRLANDGKRRCIECGRATSRNYQRAKKFNRGLIH